MNPNQEIITQAYRTEIENLLSSDNSDIMLVLTRFKQSGKRLFEIKRPRTTFLGGLISIQNPIFDSVAFVGVYPHHNEEISVFVEKDGTKLFFMTGILGTGATNHPAANGKDKET